MMNYHLFLILPCPLMDEMEVNEQSNKKGNFVSCCATFLSAHFFTHSSLFCREMKHLRIQEKNNLIMFEGVLFLKNLD